MELPTLPEFVAEVGSRLAAERARRRRFYEELPDGAKWEFINGEVIMHSPDMVRPMAVRRNLQSLLWNYVNLRGLGTVLAAEWPRWPAPASRHPGRRRSHPRVGNAQGTRAGSQAEGLLPS